MKLLKRLRSKIKAWRIGRISWADITDNFSAKGLSRKPKDIQDYIVSNLIILVYSLGSHSTIALLNKLRSIPIPESPYLWIPPVVSSLLTDLSRYKLKGFRADITEIEYLMRDRELLVNRLLSLLSFDYPAKFAKENQLTGSPIAMTKLLELHVKFLNRLIFTVSCLTKDGLDYSVTLPLPVLYYQLPIRYLGILQSLAENQQEIGLLAYFEEVCLQEEDVDFIREFKS